MIRLCAFSDEAAEDLAGQIAALGRHGIRLTELRSVGKKNVADLTREEARLCRKQLAEAGISVWSVGSPLGKVSVEVDFSAYLEKVRQVCELACELGTDKIRMFSFYEAHGKGGQVFEYLGRMCEVARAEGVTLYHENEKEIYGDTVGRVQEIMAQVPALKFVYDPGNYLMVGEDPQTAFSFLRDKTAYYHIKDVDLKTREHVPAGEGDGHIPELVRALSGDTTLTVEPHLAMFGAYKHIDRTEMKQARRFSDRGTAFDAAVLALKGVLADAGYHETDGGYEK